MLKAIFHVSLAVTAIFIGMRLGSDVLRSIGTPSK